MPTRQGVHFTAFPQRVYCTRHTNEIDGNGESSSHLPHDHSGYPFALVATPHDMEKARKGLALDIPVESNIGAACSNQPFAKGLRVGGRPTAHRKLHHHNDSETPQAAVLHELGFQFDDVTNTVIERTTQKFLAVHGRSTFHKQQPIGPRRQGLEGFLVPRKSELRERNVAKKNISTILTSNGKSYVSRSPRPFKSSELRLLQSKLADVTTAQIGEQSEDRRDDSAGCCVAGFTAGQVQAANQRAMKAVHHMGDPGEMSIKVHICGVDVQAVLLPEEKPFSKRTKVNSAGIDRIWREKRQHVRKEVEDVLLERTSGGTPSPGNIVLHTCECPCCVVVEMRCVKLTKGPEETGRDYFGVETKCVVLLPDQEAQNVRSSFKAAGGECPNTGTNKDTFNADAPFFNIMNDDGKLTTKKDSCTLAAGSDLLRQLFGESGPKTTSHHQPLTTLEIFECTVSREVLRTPFDLAAEQFRHGVKVCNVVICRALLQRYGPTLAIAKTPCTQVDALSIAVRNGSMPEFDKKYQTMEFLFENPLIDPNVTQFNAMKRSRPRAGPLQRCFQEGCTPLLLLFGQMFEELYVFKLAQKMIATSALRHQRTPAMLSPLLDNGATWRKRLLGSMWGTRWRSFGNTLFMERQSRAFRLFELVAPNAEQLLPRSGSSAPLLKFHEIPCFFHQMWTTQPANEVHYLLQLIMDNDGQKTKTEFWFNEDEETGEESYCKHHSTLFLYFASTYNISPLSLAAQLTLSLPRHPVYSPQLNHRKEPHKAFLVLPPAYPRSLGSSCVSTMATNGDIPSHVDGNATGFICWQRGGDRVEVELTPEDLGRAEVYDMPPL